ncbi:MAG: hypothetical protein ACRDPY_39460 [Streptosporangiaceae bacterium]
MPVLLWVAIAVILIAVFFTATGRGGELAYEHADHAPLNLGAVSGADVALLRPPTALWGYNMQVTDSALDTIAQALRDRDVAIAHLQQQVTDLNYHVHGTTPAPPVGQDFPTRIDEGPIGFQPRPFPGRHEAHVLTPPEAWLAPAEAPAAENLPDPLVWEAPDPEAQQDQPWPSPEDQASPQAEPWPSPEDQASPQAEPRPSPEDQASPQAEPWPSPEDQASPAPGHTDPQVTGFAPDPGAPSATHATHAASAVSGPGADPSPTAGPGPAVGPGTTDAAAGPEVAGPTPDPSDPSDPSGAAGRHAAEGGGHEGEQG